MRVTDLPDGVRVIAPSGFLDFAAVVRIENEFKAKVDAWQGSVILDMSEVPFCGSLGIRMLLAAARAAKMSKIALTSGSSERGAVCIRARWPRIEPSVSRSGWPM